MDLAGKVHHPMVLGLEITQSLGAEAVGDDAGAMPNVAGGGGDGRCRVQQQLLGVVRGRRRRRGHGHGAVEHRRVVGEVDREGDHLLPQAVGRELEEARLAEARGGVGAGLGEARVQARAGEVGSRYLREPDLAQEVLQLGVLDRGEGGAAGRLEEPVGEQRERGLGLRPRKHRAGGRRGRLEALDAVFQHGERGEVAPAAGEQLPGRGHPRRGGRRRGVPGRVGDHEVVLMRRGLD
uniref:Uncharacterized protein n=1 Tax=Triticum urartu TaxID=4572 RepID=A0A8R7P9J9_TRIUA